jgi:hypothetical protein
LVKLLAGLVIVVLLLMGIAVLNSQLTRARFPARRTPATIVWEVPGLPSFATATRYPTAIPPLPTKPAIESPSSQRLEHYEVGSSSK